jgi:hypothetical protein
MQKRGTHLKKLAGLLLVALISGIFTGCAAVSVQSSWKDPTVHTKQYRKLLVVGIADKMQMRQVFEEVFAGELQQKGVTGIASYTITGSQDKLSRAALEEAVRKSGADGVITTRMVSIKAKKDTRTGFIVTDRGYTNPNFSDSDIYPTDLFDYYGETVSYATFEHRGVEVTTSKKYIMETNLFDSSTRRLTWSGTSRAVDPQGIITISKDLADSIVKAMASDGLL